MTTEPMPRHEFEADKLILRFTAMICAEVSAIQPIVNGIMQVVKEMKCGAGKEFEIELALQEALANAIIHGCGNDPCKQVEVCVACDESRGLLIVVRDPGPGFDPASIASPTTGQNVFSEHGRGIFLINQCMDEVYFEQGGTEIHMRKFLGGQSIAAIARQLDLDRKTVKTPSPKPLIKGLDPSPSWPTYGRYPIKSPLKITKK